MYNIRNADIKDVETIRFLADETWHHAYGPILQKGQIDYMLDNIYSAEKLAAQIRDNLQIYLLLIEDEKPVAFAAYSPRVEDPEIYKLHKLYCLPETQGKGYGKVLIDEVAARTLAA